MWGGLLNKMSMQDSWIAMVLMQERHYMSTLEMYVLPSKPNVRMLKGTATDY